MCIETALGALMSIKHHVSRFVQMAASISCTLSGSKVKLQKRSVCDHFRHSAFSMDIFRSVQFNTYRNHLNFIEKLHLKHMTPTNNSNSNRNAHLSPIHRCLKSIDYDNKSLLKQNEVMLDAVVNHNNDKLSDENNDSNLIDNENSEERMNSSDGNAKLGKKVDLNVCQMKLKTEMHHCTQWPQDCARCLKHGKSALVG